MTRPTKVILVSEDTKLREEVNEVLNHGSGRSADGCRNLLELRDCLNAEDAMVVLVDIDPQVTAMLAELEPIVNRYAHSRFVILAAQRTPQLIVRAMQTGIRHVQLKRDIASELGLILGTLMNALHLTQTEGGTVIPILSAGGGCGATTLATHLALDLRVRTGNPVLLVDGDMHYGAIGIYMNIDALFGLGNVLCHKGNIDRALLQSTVHHYPGGLDVLLNPVDGFPPDGFESEMQRFGDFLDCCQQSYGVTLLDLPRPSHTTLVQTARASKLLMIVMQPTIKDIRIARAMVGMLENSGVSASRILVVVNRYQKRYCPVESGQLEKIFNPVQLVHVGNDYISANRATTEGEPLAKCAPRSALLRDIGALATVCLNRIKNSRSEVEAIAL